MSENSNYRLLAGIRKLSLALYQELISMGILIILQRLVLVSKIAKLKNYATGLKGLTIFVFCDQKFWFSPHLGDYIPLW